MRACRFSPMAERELNVQIDYLLIQGAFRPAEALALRVESFVSRFLIQYPRGGRFISDRDLWEIWIPGTRLVLWYRFTDEDLDVVRVWHVAQNRDDAD